MSLQIEHISYRINGSLILDDVNATADVGEITGLIGPNGAGKSTLANVLSGFIVPSKGIAHFEGQSLIGIAPQNIARLGVARTFQGQHLPWNSTPRQCLLSVLISDSGSSINRSQDHSASTAVPENPGEQTDSLLSRFCLDEVSGTPARDLSYGQQRLLALAMACARSSRMLILDEPFVGLKSVALHVVLDVLRVEARARAVIIIDHTLSAIRAIASRVWFMHRGRLTVFRNYSEMAASEVFLRNYLGANIPGSEPSAIDESPVREGLSADSHRLSVECPEAALILNDVSAGYGNNVVVRRASLEVFPGEVVCIIGVNGSGKSTLLRTIAGIAQLFEGSVRLGGERMDRLPSDKRVRMGVRLLVQDHRLFRTLSLADNLLLSATALEARGLLTTSSLTASRAAINSAATMQKMLESTGPKFTKRVAGTYSGGEQARVALAQIDFGEPRVILLDEPTSGIDGVAAQSLVSAIGDWQQRRIPVVIVEHALEFVASISTRVLLMAGGELHPIDPLVRDSSQLMEQLLIKS